MSARYSSMVKAADLTARKRRRVLDQAVLAYARGYGSAAVRSVLLNLAAGSPWISPWRNSAVRWIRGEFARLWAAE